MSDDDENTFWGIGPREGDPERLDEWLKGRPEIIHKLAREWPPWFCYRSTENAKFHCRIVGYSETGRVTLAHGNDSTMPGVQTFGQPPAQLRVCACGRWEEPTPANTEATRQRLRAWARRPGGAHEACTDPRCVVCQDNPTQDQVN